MVIVNTDHGFSSGGSMIVGRKVAIRGTTKQRIFRFLSGIPDIRNWRVAGEGLSYRIWTFGDNLVVFWGSDFTGYARA